MTYEQELLLGWTVGHLALLKDDGELVVPDNTPLSVEQIIEVLNFAADAATYVRQTVSVPDTAGRRVVLRVGADGPVVETMPFIDAPHPRRLRDGETMGFRWSS